MTFHLLQGPGPLSLTVVDKVFLIGLISGIVTVLVTRYVAQSVVG
jgi:hypothetical protein